MYAPLAKRQHDDTIAGATKVVASAVRERVHTSPGLRRGHHVGCGFCGLLCAMVPPQNNGMVEIGRLCVQALIHRRPKGSAGNVRNKAGMANATGPSGKTTKPSKTLVLGFLLGHKSNQCRNNAMWAHGPTERYGCETNCLLIWFADWRTTGRRIPTTCIAKRIRNVACNEQVQHSLWPTACANALKTASRAQHTESVDHT